MNKIKLNSLLFFAAMILGLNIQAQSYCTATTNFGFEYINEISTAGAITNINYNVTSGPPQGYDDQTALTFESHASQTFTLTSTYFNGSNRVNIWVDLNNDMVFDGNEVLASNGFATNTQSHSITIPAGTPIGDYRMRVRGVFGASNIPPACGMVFSGSTVDFKLSIVAPPGCLPPTALNVSNITPTSADLGWTEINSATSWNIEYGLAGFTQGSGTTVNGVTSNPYAALLTPGNQYSFYVQSDCGNGVSAWAGPFNFANSYCDYTITSNTPQYIKGFETTGALLNIDNTATGFGITSPGYSDYTMMSAVGYSGQTVGFTVTGGLSSIYGVAIYVDWNDDFTFDSSEKVYGTTNYTNLPLTNSFVIPQTAAIGQHRMRVIADNFSAGPPPCTGTSAEAEDYIFEVIDIPTCLPPSNLMANSATQTSIEIGWIENNGATSWNVEYGPAGYTQGTGTILNGVTSNPLTISGLNPSVTYEIYLQSDCGGGDQSYWTAKLVAATDCGVSVAPFYEGFNNAAQPSCWESLSSFPSTLANNLWRFSGAPAYGALNNGKAGGKFAWASGNTPNPDSMILVTPEIDISQLNNPYLSFEWFSNNTDNPGDNNPLIVELFNGSQWVLLDTLRADSSKWMFQDYDLNAYLNIPIKVRFTVNQTLISSSALYNDILLDEIIIDECIQGQGTSGSMDVCSLDNTVNLENNIIVKPTGNGYWAFPSQPLFLINDTIFNISNISGVSYDVLYLERTVCYDTTFATINVFKPSSAGTDGPVTVCMNEPINLFSALGGNCDLGGEWFDFTNTLLPNSQPKAQATPGQYIYTYIANNGVCPADTSIVTVTVKSDCDFLSLGQELFTDISVFPNPAISQLNIVNPSNTASLKVEMLDMNGRVVLVENKALNNASEATLAIDFLEKGIYTLRVYNNEGQKTFKIVKQ